MAQLEESKLQEELDDISNLVQPEKYVKDRLRDSGPEMLYEQILGSDRQQIPISESPYIPMQ